MNYQAKLYSCKDKNPAITFSDDSKLQLGVCFSGGGSRALTCAWGQMLGLETLGLMNQGRYVSSVSGGTWASSVYAFLPNHITNEDLLGRYVPPSKLSLSQGAGLFDINEFNSQYSLGQAPATMDLSEVTPHILYFLHHYPNSQHKWLWASLIAEHVLKPFDLQAKGEQLWQSTHSFSLSQSYASSHFPQQSPSLDQLYYLRQGRPFLIMNDNMICPVEGTNPVNSVYLPHQVTPVSGGAKGQTPSGSIVGGGTVETYGYSAILDQPNADSSAVNVNVEQPYSLIDIVSTSSSFFAGALVDWINDHLKDKDKREDFIKQAHAQVKAKKHFFGKIEDNIQDLAHQVENDIEGIVAHTLDKTAITPAFNYWPLNAESQNSIEQFTDGGTLENTGILGMLAQTDTGQAQQKPLHILAFDNTETPLTVKNGKVIAAGQVAPLFGIDFCEKTGEQQAFSRSQQDPKDPKFVATSLIQIFDNTSSDNTTPFDQIVAKLHKSNCGATNQLNSSPAFAQVSLTTVANSLANITADRKVELLYVQNAKTLDWQNALQDSSLKQQIEIGQSGKKDPFTPFQGFPNYNTFFKIGLEAKESNALSQMWAWSVADDDSPLKDQIRAFYDAAANE